MPKPTWIQTCTTCAWFSQSVEYAGTCHCKPPTADGFPVTHKDHWCARWQNIDDVNKWADEEDDKDGIK